MKYFRHLVSILAAACIMLAGAEKQFEIATKIHQYYDSEMERINNICRPATGIPRWEMLNRFSVADGAQIFVLSEHDKNLKQHVARFFWRIPDSDIYYVFTYSYDRRLIVSWSLQKDNSYKVFDFIDYIDSPLNKGIN